MVADEFVCTLTKNRISIYTSDVDNIISNKTMTTFNELQSGLAFTYTAFTRKKNSDTIYFNKNTMEGFSWCENIRENSDDSLGEFRRPKIRLQDRNT